MILLQTAKYWGKAPSDYFWADPLKLAVDHEGARILAASEKQLQEEAEKDKGKAV